MSKSDSFSDLLSFAGGSSSKSKNNNNLSMQERLKQQQLKKEQEKTNLTQSWGASLDALGSGFSSPSLVSSPFTSNSTASTQNSTAPQAEEEDPFDIFNKPPPPKVSQPVESAEPALSPNDSLLEGFTDAFPTKQQQQHYSSSSTSTNRSSSSSTRASTPARNTESPKPRNGDPRDPYIAELVDMGFSLDQAKRGLANTDNGLDVRQAIDFLMMEAHSKATGKPMERTSSARRTNSSRRSNGTSSNGASNQDISKMAQEFSTQFISKGLSLFNQVKKNTAKAIEQYSHGQAANDGTPAWMREQERYKQRANQKFDQDAQEIDLKNPRKHEEKLTDDVRMLDRHDNQEDSWSTSRNPFRTSSPSQSQPSQVFKDAPFKDSDSEEEDSIYSKPPPSRSAPTPPPPRKKSIPASTSKPAPSSTLSRAQQFKLQQEKAEELPMRRRPTPKSASLSSAGPAAKTPSKKPPPKKEIPVSSIALDMYNTSKAAGTDAFKRGDFTEAVTHYTKAEQALPHEHPLRAVALSNRAICNLKLGDSKSALNDADQGLMLVDIQDQIWSKLSIRRAEALEAREQFYDAKLQWEALIENGFATSTVLDGKRRCQRELEPKKKPVSAKPKPTAPLKRTVPAKDSVQVQQAVNRMREADQVAEKEENEKFALVDVVEEKITIWKKGKEDNLRGLLSTLDTLLWPELGWKKVNLTELLVEKKVKINYMKAVAKTHPDKVPGSATTEQKMIAQAVFVALNKAWDDFKVQNHMN